MRDTKGQPEQQKEILSTNSSKPESIINHGLSSSRHSSSRFLPFVNFTNLAVLYSKDVHFYDVENPMLDLF